MYTGNVCSMLERKKANTNSSKEIVNVSRRLAIMPGNTIGNVTRQKGAQLMRTSAGLRPQLLQQGIRNRQHDLARVAGSFVTAANTRVARHRAQLDGLERLRQTLGYKETLKRGYAVVRNDKGKVINGVTEAQKARSLNIEFADGRMDVGSSPPKPKPAKKPPPPSGEQGSLF